MVTTDWQHQLQNIIQSQATHLTGCQVATAVTQATDAAWYLGLDAAYHQLVAKVGVREDDAEAFHNAWLVVFAMKLYERAESTRRPRISGSGLSKC